MTPTTTKRKLPRQQETTTNNIKWLCTTTPTVQVIKQEKPKCVSLIALCKRTVIITEGGKFSPIVQQNTGLQGAFLSHMHKILVYRGHFSLTCTKYWFTGGISLSRAQNTGLQGAFLSHMHKIWLTGGSSLSHAQNMVYRGHFSPIVYRTLVYRGHFSPIVYRTLVYKGR